MILIVTIVSSGIVYALLSQSLPTTMIPQSTVASNCGSLQTSSVVTASSGAIQYTCSGAEAIKTVAGTSSYSLTGYTSCPSVVTSPCYTNLGYVAHGDTTQCVAGATIGPAFHPISGATNPLTFTAGSWDYCAFYAATSTGGTLPGFTIAWSP
jgi:hypothetical protein